MDAVAVVDPEGEPAGIDSPAQPEPEYIFDQRISCKKPLVALTKPAYQAAALRPVWGPENTP